MTHIPRSPRGLMQEFTAGAQAVQKELLVRRDDGATVLLLAVDERRQHGLAELFVQMASGVQPGALSARWNVLQRDATLAAVRLDLAFRRPLRLQLRLLFNGPNSIVVQHGADTDQLCLLTTGSFTQLGRTGVCGRESIVIPMPRAAALVAALRTR